MIIASLAIDYVDGFRRCGGSALYSPLPLWLLNEDYELYYVASSNYPFNIPYVGSRIDADRDFVFRLFYHDDERDIKLDSFPTTIDEEKLFMISEDTVLVNALYNEFSIDLIEHIVKESKISSFDLQGLLRERREDGKITVRGELEYEYRSILEDAVIVKVGEDEYKSWTPIGEIFIVTKGTRGCSLYVDNEWIHVPSVKVEKVAVGTGDMHISYFTHCYKGNRDAIECAIKSNALVSSIIEFLDFVKEGCLNWEKVYGLRNRVMELWKERIEIIRSQV